VALTRSPPLLNFSRKRSALLRIPSRMKLRSSTTFKRRKTCTNFVTEVSWRAILCLFCLTAALFIVLKNVPFYFLSSGEPNHKRWFVLCEDFAQSVMQKSTWINMLHCIGRTNEAMEVHSLNTAKFKTMLALLRG
jgi:hypothetical protein